MKNLNIEKTHESIKESVKVNFEDLGLDRYIPINVFCGTENREMLFGIKDRFTQSVLENERGQVLSFYRFEVCSSKLRELNHQFWTYRKLTFGAHVKAEIKKLSNQLTKSLECSDEVNSIVQKLKTFNQMNLNLDYQGLICPDCNEYQDLNDCARYECECSRAVDKEYS